MRGLVILIVTAALAGCAYFPMQRSSVGSSLTPSESTQIARDVGAYVGSTFPAAQTVIALERPRVIRLQDDMGPVLAQVLRISGFAVLESTAELPGARRLTYIVSGWEDGISVRVELDQYVISRWYIRSGNGLVPASPFTVKKGLSHGHR